VRNEVRGFRETATRLAHAVAASPPLGLRERVLTAASVTRQLPPEVREMPRARLRLARSPWLPRLAVAVAAAAWRRRWPWVSFSRPPGSS